MPASLAGRPELRRYSRHLLIPEVGLAGQEKLARARVLCIGAGGLGSPVLAYLAAAGVGRIGIVDDDTVDVTNLQRQIVYATADVGAPKAAVAAERLRALNPQISIDAIPLRFDRSNARELVRLYDVVVDGTDTFGARYLINDACVLEGKPDVYGSIFRFDGQVSVFGTAGGPCYRCLYPEPPPEHLVPTCAEGGVLGALAGIVGTWQASEALKLVLGIGTPLVGRLLLIDALDARMREVRIARDPACPLCGDAPDISDVGSIPERTTASERVPALVSADLDALLAREPDARVLDVRDPHERIFGSVPGAVEIPAGELEARLHELDSARTYVVACRVGAKSRWAAERLKDAGFGKLYHLRDGLLAYAAVRDGFDVFQDEDVLQVQPTLFAEAKVFVPDVFEDDRGFFKESWSQPKYEQAGLGILDWAQDSTSWSTRNVLRGMHYDFRMAKLVQCLHGRIFDAIVDVRRESPTYLRWQGFILSAANHRQLFVPAGFAHGFLALDDDVVVHYKNSVPFDAASEGAISWRNRRVGIVWPLAGEPRLSAKDAAVGIDTLP